MNLEIQQYDRFRQDTVKDEMGKKKKKMFLPPNRVIIHHRLWLPVPHELWFKEPT